MDLANLDIAVNIDFSGVNAGLSQLNGQLAAFEQTFGQFGLALGRDLVVVENTLKTIADSLSKLAPAANTSQSALGHVAGEVGNVISTMATFAGTANTFMSFWGKISEPVFKFGGELLRLLSSMGLVSEGAGGLAAALEVLTGPIGWIIAAIGLLVIAFVRDWGHIRTVTMEAIDFIKPYVISAWEFIRDYVLIAVEAIASHIQSAWKEVRDWTLSWWPEIQKTIMEVWKTIGPFVMEAVYRIRAVITTAWSIIKTVSSVVWNNISLIIGVVWESIKLIVGDAIDRVLTIIRAFCKLLRGDWSGAWEEIKGLAQRSLERILNFFHSVGSRFREAGRNLIKYLVQGIKDLMAAPAKAVAEAMAKALEAAHLRNQAAAMQKYADSISVPKENALTRYRAKRDTEPKTRAASPKDAAPQKAEKEGGWLANLFGGKGTSSGAVKWPSVGGGGAGTSIGISGGNAKEYDQASEALKRMNQELVVAANKESILKDEFNLNAEKCRILQEGYNALVEAGLKPGDAQLEKVGKRLAAVRAEMQKTEPGEIMRELGKGIEFIADKEKALGDAYDDNAEKASLLQNKIVSLLEQGYKPGDDIIKNLQARLQQVNNDIKAQAASGGALDSYKKQLGDLNQQAALLGNDGSTLAQLNYQVEQGDLSFLKASMGAEKYAAWLKEIQATAAAIDKQKEAIQGKTDADKMLDDQQKRLDQINEEIALTGHAGDELFKFNTQVERGKFAYLEAALGAEEYQKWLEKMRASLTETKVAQDRLTAATKENGEVTVRSNEQAAKSYENLAEKANSALTTMTEDIKKYIKEGIDKLSEALRTNFEQGFKDLMNGNFKLKDFLKKLWTDIEGILKSIWDNIVSNFAQALAKMVAMAILNKLGMQAAMGGNNGIASAVSSAIGGAGTGGGISTSQAIGYGAAGLGGYFVGKAIGGSSGGSYGASMAMVGMMVGGPIGAVAGAVLGGLIGRNSGHNTESVFKVNYLGGQVKDTGVNLPSSTLESTNFQYTQPEVSSTTIENPQIVIQAQDIGGPTERKRIAGELWKEIKKVAAGDNRRFGASMVTG